MGGRLSSRLLLLLRWLACLGQAATLAAAHGAGVSIPWMPCALAVGFTLLSNAALAWWFSQLKHQHFGGAFHHVLLWDVFTLTFLLYWTGGLGNPFAMFFLVQLTLAAVALRAGAAASLGVVMAGMLLFLHWHHVPLRLHGGQAPPQALLSLGALAAVLLAGGFVLVMLVGVRKRSHRLQIERQALRAELDARDRFLSVAALATGFAHELATPLGTIGLAAGEMEAEPDRETAALIVREVQRCQAVLQRLRELGQEAVGRTVEPCAAAGVVSAALEELPVAQRSRVRVRLEAGEVRLACAGLREALLVLLRNALMSSPDDKPVQLDVGTHGSNLHFSVRDQGPGFSAEMLRHWGEPFRTTREPGAGTGLGLFFVRRLAAAMQGRVDVENCPSGGARVTLVLPVHSAPPTSLP